MKLIINGEETEYTLGQEKTVREILNSLEQYLNKENYTILKIFADEEDITTTDIDKNIEEVKELNIIAQQTSELLSETINSVIEHIDKLIKNCPNLLKSFASKDDKFQTMVENYKEGIKVIDQIFESIVILLRINTNEVKYENENLTVWIGRIKLLKRGFDEIIKSENSNQILGYIAQTLPKSLSEIKGLYESFTQKNTLKEETLDKEAIAKLKDNLSSISKEFENTAVLLQTGNKTKGMEKLVTIIDILQESIRKLNYAENLKNIVLSNGQGFSEFYNETQEKLKELLGAFEREDMVLLSDLVEYELSDISSKIIEILDKYAE